MTTGIGFQEVLLVGVLVLLLFGAKGVSGVMRDLGRLAGKLKRHRDEFNRELLAISNPAEAPADEEAIKKEEKNRIRREALKKVIALPAEAKAAQSRTILEKLGALEEFRAARKVFCYASLPHEADTRPLIAEMIRQGKTVYLPYCILDGMKIEISPVADLARDTAPGLFGILEPAPGTRRACDALEPELFIIPGVAFDAERSRVGRGKGFFDRFLAGVTGKRPLWALAFNEQIYPFVPQLAHDIRPDMLVTPDLVYTSGAGV